MLVGRKTTPDDDVRPLKRNLAWRAADRVSGSVLDALRPPVRLLSLVVRRSPSDPWFRDADVVQLHNLHGSYFSFTALPLLTPAPAGRLAAARPVGDDRPRRVLARLRALEARVRQRARTSSEYPRLRRDTTAILWRMKRRRLRALAAADRRALALDRATSSLASPLLERFPARHIPNGIDIDVFSPGSTGGGARAAGSAARPEDRLLRGGRPARAPQGAAPARAGAAAARRPAAAPARRGRGDAAKESSRACSARSRTRWCSRDAYRAADVFAVPTLADVLTQTAQESHRLRHAVRLVRQGRRDRGRAAPRDRATRRSSATSTRSREGLATLLGRRRADREAERTLPRGRRGASSASSSRSSRYVELYDEVLAAA